MPTPKHPRARSLTAVHAAWCIGPRRVALACSEDTRPAACCVLDALVARGYDVVLHTGVDARSALRPAPDDPGRLRVLWIPDYDQRPTKDQLRRALDPAGAGDVLVLVSPTPRGVIEAIEAFASGRERPRTRSGPRRTYLDHPTCIESTIELQRIGPSALAAVAATAALLLAVKLGSPMAPIASAPAPTPTPVRATAPSHRAMDASVLGSAVTPLDEDEMTEAPPRPVRTRSRSTRAASATPEPVPRPPEEPAPLAPAPLEEDVAPTRAAVPVLAAPTHEAVRAVRRDSLLIDPFAP